MAVQNLRVKNRRTPEQLEALNLAPGQIAVLSKLYSGGKDIPALAVKNSAGKTCVFPSGEVATIDGAEAVLFPTGTELLEGTPPAFLNWASIANKPQGFTPSSHSLDSHEDCERGTWTPTIGASSGAGEYTRYGNLLYLNFWCSYTPTGNTGLMTVTGLPLSIGSENGLFNCVNVTLSCTGRDTVLYGLGTAENSAFFYVTSGGFTPISFADFENGDTGTIAIAGRGYILI